MEHLFAIALKVMPIGSSPIVKMRVVIDTPNEVAKAVVKPVSQRLFILSEPQMPLADMAGSISRISEQIDHRE